MSVTVGTKCIMCSSCNDSDNFIASRQFLNNFSASEFDNSKVNIILTICTNCSATDDMSVHRYVEDVDAICSTGLVKEVYDQLIMIEKNSTMYTMAGSEYVLYSPLSKLESTR